MLLVLNEIQNEISFYSRILWIFTLFFIALAILWISVGIVTSLLSSFTVQEDSIAGPIGVYLWSLLASEISIFTFKTNFIFILILHLFHIFPLFFSIVSDCILCHILHPISQYYAEESLNNWAGPSRVFNTGTSEVSFSLFHKHDQRATLWHIGTIRDRTQRVPEWNRHSRLWMTWALFAFWIYNCFWCRVAGLTTKRVPHNNSNRISWIASRNVAKNTTRFGLKKLYSFIRTLCHTICPGRELPAETKCEFKKIRSLFFWPGSSSTIANILIRQRQFCFQHKKRTSSKIFMMSFRSIQTKRV